MRRLLWIFLPALLVGCVLPVFGETEPKKPVVVCTTTMVTDLVRQIAGEACVVEGLMGPATDPHLYRPAARDAARLRQADLIFYSGLHLEGRMTDLFESMQRRGKAAVAVTGKIPQEKLLSAGQGGHWDPHVWFDPQLWSLCIGSVVDALGQKVPERKAFFEEQGEKLRKQYAVLDAWVREELKKIPEEKRVLVTSHDAYHYFGRAYGMQVVGVQGISTVTEAGLADIARVADLIRARKLLAIFVETSVSPATIERISRDSGAVVGGELFSDATGEAGKKERGSDGTEYDLGTCEGMMRHNVQVMVKALAGV